MSPPRRGRSPPLVASSLFFLSSSSFARPMRAKKQLHNSIWRWAAEEKRERGDRKEKKKEPMQIKTKKVSALLSFPFFSSFSPPLLSLREEEETTKTSVSLEGGEGERGKKAERGVCGVEKLGHGGGEGKRGEGTKIGRRKRSEDDKKGVPLLLPAPFPPFPFCDPIRLRGKGKEGEKESFPLFTLPGSFTSLMDFFFFWTKMGRIL